MATGDVLLGLVLLLFLQLRIIMQISHGQRICKGQRVVSLTGCPYPCATPSLPVSPLYLSPCPSAVCVICLGICLDLWVSGVLWPTTWLPGTCVCHCVYVCVGVCDILCPTRSPLVLAVIVGVARLATRRIRNIRLTRVCLFVYLLAVLCCAVLCLLCLFSLPVIVVVFILWFTISVNCDLYTYSHSHSKWFTTYSQRSNEICNCSLKVLCIHDTNIVYNPQIYMTILPLFMALALATLFMNMSECSCSHS